MLHSLHSSSLLIHNPPSYFGLEGEADDEAPEQVGREVRERVADVTQVLTLLHMTCQWREFRV